MNPERGFAHWLNARTAGWQALGHKLERQQRGKRNDVADALQIVEGYRTLGRDLSVARRVLPRSRLTLGLEGLYARAHSLIHRPAHNGGARLRALLRDEIPAAAFAMRYYILWVSLLFALSLGAGWWLVGTFPELASLVASEKMITEVESGRLWTDGLLNVIPSSVLSVQILANNIAVTLIALCVGVFFGLGTFYIIGMNGLMIGGVFAFTHQHGMAGALLKFVLAHGLVELSVICIAGGCGMAIGAAIAIPTHKTRRESFQRATADVGKVMLMCAALLVACGFIEGYISPDDAFPMWVRAVVGICYWIIMVTALTGHLTRRLKP